MSNPLAPLLASSVFSADDAALVLANDQHPDRTKLLAAVRAESNERFLQALAAIFQAVDWAAQPDVLHPMLSLVGRFSLDHLAIVDVLNFAQQTDRNDADYALDVVCAIELDDAAAAERVKERVAIKTVPSTLTDRPPVLFNLPADPIGGVRAAALLRSFLGNTDEEQLRRAVSAGVGGGNYAAFLAASIAASRGLALPEDVYGLQDSRRLGGRLMVWVASAIAPAFGEEMLKAVVDSAWWDTADIEAYRMPWDRSVEKVADGKITVTRLLGSTVLKATAPFDSFAGPWSKKATKWRISSKQYPDAKKAVKDFEKAAAAAGEAPSYSQAALDARLYQVANATRERVAELLRCGANPNGPTGETDAYWSGSTALLRAGGSDDSAEVIRLLLAAGADARAEWQGGSAIDHLSSGNPASVLAAEHLIAAGVRCLGTSRLFDAAQHGYHRFAAALVRAGADLKATRDGKTPVEVALEHKHLRTAMAFGYRP